VRSVVGEVGLAGLDRVEVLGLFGESVCVGHALLIG
jgi:hypothetical protein